jgi:hypothetical protein
VFAIKKEMNTLVILIMALVFSTGCLTVESGYPGNLKSQALLGNSCSCNVQETSQDKTFSIDFGSKGLSQLTGGAVQEPVAEKKKAQQTKPKKAQEIKRDTQIQQKSCLDECQPKGNRCSDEKTLLKCSDHDGDGCLEKTELECTFGCSNLACNSEEEYEENISETIVKSDDTQDGEGKKDEDHVPQSELMKKSSGVLSTFSSCDGRLLGNMQWNEDGGLCRKHTDDDSVGKGYINPLRCCKTLYTNSDCFLDQGLIRDTHQALYYHTVQCYD